MNLDPTKRYFIEDVPFSNKELNTELQELCFSKKIPWCGTGYGVWFTTNGYIVIERGGTDGVFCMTVGIRKNEITFGYKYTYISFNDFKRLLGVPVDKQFEFSF